MNLIIFLSTQKFTNKIVLILLSIILGFSANLIAQNQCRVGIVGIWEEGQDALSALLAEKKVFKFYEGDKVEIYQFNSAIEDFILLGSGNYKIDNISSTSKIIFSNLTVLIFQAEGSFAFTILKFEDSILEWQGIFGIVSRLHKIYMPMYDVQLITQPDIVTCWAASATMMYSWKKKKEYTISGALSELENGLGSYGIAFRLQKYLPKTFGFKELANNLFYEKLMGMTEVRYTPTIQGLEELLTNHGPLLVGLENINDPNHTTAYYHARVINGITIEPNNECAYLNILDPWAFDNAKQIYVESYEDFKKKINKTYTGKQPGMFKIYHW